jgi:hypothetical protein
MLIATALVLIALALLLMGAHGGATSSGVRGRVFEGPTCPVMRVGVACPNRPLAGIIISTAGHTTISTTGGHFALTLTPGLWRLRAHAAGAVYPLPAQVWVRVRSGRYTLVSIILDSGIR